ncbi:MAG: DUF882 domain-containing protein, partial [Ensifer adhaerens]
MDVGGVRAWPRMTRNELARLFPDGKTMHVPSDGKPLPGYNQAVADYKRRVGASAIEVAGGGAKAGDAEGGKRRGNLFAMLFGGGGDEDEEPSAIAAGPGEGEEAAPAKVQTASAPATQEALPGVAGSVAAETTTAETTPADQDINAPVPAVRPAFKDTPENGGVAVALVAPQKNAAQEALAAALPQTPEMPSEFADLASVKVPVPQMLDRGGMNAAAGETLVASVDPLATDMQALGFVPVPAMRPAGDAALAAVADAKVAVPAFAERPVLASAEPPRDTMAQASTRVALAAPTQAQREPVAQPVEMAAYAPQTSTNGRADVFDSAFDTQAEAPAKGGRPKKHDADAATRSSVRTEPKLTQKIISEWALSAGRVATLSKPVKAPRFVSKTLRTAPTTVYAAGFSSGAGTVDTARFSGNAVNFMEVKKFSTN